MKNNVMNSKKVIRQTEIFNTGSENTFSKSPFMSRNALPDMRDKKLWVANIYFEEMKPLFYVFRIMGFLPYHITSKGEMVLKIMSLAMLYTLIMTAAIICTTVFAIRSRMNTESSRKGTYEYSVLETSIILSSAILIVGPCTYLLEYGKLIRFINSWRSLQENFLQVTGKPLLLGARRGVRIVTVLAVPSAMIAGVGLRIMEPNLQLYLTIFTLLPVFVAWSLSWIFAYSCFSIKTVAKSIGNELEEYIASRGCDNPDRVIEYKFLWLQLSQMTQDLGNSVGYSFGSFMILLFACQVLTCYGFFSALSGGLKLINVPPGITTIIITLILFGLCSAAQCTTHEVGLKFQERLQGIINQHPPTNSLTNNEIQFFFSTISSNPPTINFCGFVEVNRHLSTAMMSQMVTYLIVLTQFKSSSENDNAATNKNMTILNTTTS